MSMLLMILKWEDSWSIVQYDSTSDHELGEGHDSYRPLPWFHRSTCWISIYKAKKNENFVCGKKKWWTKKKIQSSFLSQSIKLVEHWSSTPTSHSARQIPTFWYVATNRTESSHATCDNSPSSVSFSCTPHVPTPTVDDPPPFSCTLVAKSGERTGSQSVCCVRKLEWWWWRGMRWVMYCCYCCYFGCCLASCCCCCCWFSWWLDDDWESCFFVVGRFFFLMHDESLSDRKKNWRFLPMGDSHPRNDSQDARNNTQKHKQFSSTQGQYTLF